MICHQAGAQEAVREHNWDCWPELAKRTLSIIEPHVQDINWGKLARSHRSWLGDGLGIGQQVVSNCVVHLFLLGLIPHFLSVISIIIWSSSSNISIITFYFVSVIKVFLSQPKTFTFFPLQLSFPLGVGVGEEREVKKVEGRRKSKWLCGY